MVRLKEMWGGKSVTKLGAFKFPTNVFKDEIKYPQWEMSQSLDLYENRPQVNSGIKQIARFIVGNEIKIKSEDERTQNFLNSWLDLRQPQIIQ